MSAMAREDDAGGGPRRLRPLLDIGGQEPDAVPEEELPEHALEQDEQLAWRLKRAFKNAGLG